MVRVMVVDDHPMWRDAVERDLQAAGHDVVGVASNGREAMARLAMHFNGPGSAVTLLSLPGIGNPTVVGLHDGRVVILVTLTVRDGRITHADAVLDPNQLAGLSLLLDT